MTSICRICKATAVGQEHVSMDSGMLVMFQSCPTCGRWKALGDLVVPEFSRPANAHLMPYLAAHIRQSNERGEATVELNAILVSQELLDTRPGKSSDFPHFGSGLGPAISGDFRGVPGACFMAFNSSLRPAFDEGILPALEKDCGFLASRVDRTPHNDNITDRIITEIRAAQFVVADFTLQRPGVYYEAGFAQGLGRTVVKTCKGDDSDNLHFDTRQFFHIKWSTPAELRTLLADHIKATIGPWRRAT